MNNQIDLNAIINYMVLIMVMGMMMKMMTGVVRAPRENASVGYNSIEPYLREWR